MLVTRVRLPACALMTNIHRPIAACAEMLVAGLHGPVISTAEWRSGKRVGLITQRSVDRNHAPLLTSGVFCFKYKSYRRRGGIEPLHVSMPREVKSRPSASPTHPGIQVISQRIL
jgi:hypothetical protein